MKKFISAILLICICLNLCACGKSEEAQNVDDLILSIGEVTLSDKYTINAANEQYELLPKSQKSYVENYDILVNAIKELTYLEEQQAQLEENYLKVLKWIANNGTAKESGGINNFGQITGYYYYFKKGATTITLEFDLNDSGEIRPTTYLNIERTDRVKEVDDVQYDIRQSVYLFPTDSELHYYWLYRGFFLRLIQYSSIAQGEIHEKDISQMTRTKSDYEIENYEANMFFRNISGYTDVRKEINEDFFSTMDLFEEFLIQKIGITMADIGFTSYS